MRVSPCLAIAAWGLASLGGCACADAELISMADAGAGANCYAANDCPPGLYCNEFYRCVGPGSLDGGTFVPPETEPMIGRPQGGLHNVYVAMTGLDSVARIHSESLEVHSVAVGDAPSALAAVPDQDLAVVLNTGSDTASILRTVDDEDRVVTLPTLPDLNQLRVDDRGEVAVAFFQLGAAGSQAVGSLQDLTVLHLQPGAESVSHVSVGFRPSEVVFSVDGTQAFAITEDGISILDLDPSATDFVAPAVPLSASPMTEGPPSEVLVAPDGRLAFARWPGLAAVRSVELSNGAIIDTALPGVPTDIDLTADGNTLIAVVRETSQLVRLDLPAALGQPGLARTLDCAPLDVGQATLSPDGRWALVFTNTSNQRALIRADLHQWSTDMVGLRKAVRAVAFAPDAQTAVILHNKVPGDPQSAGDLQEVLDRRYGFSLLDVDTLFVKLQLTEADPGALAFLPDSRAAYALVASASSATRQVAAIDLASYITTTLTLGSLPTDIGIVVGTQRVFVLQDHPMGRISFVHAGSDEVRTVTGFELNSQITE